MPKIKKLDILIGATEFIASIATGALIGDLAKAVVPIESSRAHKILVSIGGYTVGAVLSDLSAKYVSSQLNSYRDRFIPDAVEYVSEGEDKVEYVSEEELAANVVPEPDYVVTNSVGEGVVRVLPEKVTIPRKRPAKAKTEEDSTEN